MRRLPWITLILAALAGLAHASPAFAAAWEFRRYAVDTGQLWRLLTAHLTHFGANHLAWDLAALLVLGTLAEREGRRATVLALALAAPLISLGVWLAQPALAVYRGLSGLDSALYGLVCARLIATGLRERHAFTTALGALALGGFIWKCAAELVGGHTVFATGADYAPVPLAHLLGLCAGLAAHALLNRPRAGDAGSRPPAWGWPCPWRPSSPGP